VVVEFIPSLIIKRERETYRERDIRRERHTERERERERETLVVLFDVQNHSCSSDIVHHF
jgi:hypothetical protein